MQLRIWLWSMTAMLGLRHANAQPARGAGAAAPAVTAVIDTTLGRITCKLLTREAPG
jgi:hypothetical protein